MTVRGSGGDSPNARAHASPDEGCTDAHARACTRVRATRTRNCCEAVHTLARSVAHHYWLVCWRSSSPTVLQHTRARPDGNLRRVPVSSAMVGAPGRCQLHATRVCSSPLFALPARLLLPPPHSGPCLLVSLPARVGVHISQVHTYVAVRGGGSPRGEESTPKHGRALSPN